jgi:ABC-type methionine transport system permease subunit
LCVVHRRTLLRESIPGLVRRMTVAVVGLVCSDQLS